MTGPIASVASPVIEFVTGADAAMFGQLFLLLGSLRRYSPEVRLRVCDLGLTDRQRDYLERTRRLLPRAAGRHLPRHAWYDKAALANFTEGLNADVVVWLDADLIVLNDIEPLVRDVCAEMTAANQIVAAAGNELTLGALDWFDQAPGFKQAISVFDLNVPYLNSGFVVCRSREFLARWAALCEALPYEFLFEQNAFNLAACEQREHVRILDSWVWNLCGTEFRSVEVVTAGADQLALIGRSGRVNILHATSTERAKDLIHYDYHFKLNDTLFRPQFRIVNCIEVLATYQCSLVVECITAEAPALLASGLGSPGETVLGTLRS